MITDIEADKLLHRPKNRPNYEPLRQSNHKKIEMNLKRSRAIPTTVFVHLTTQKLTSKLDSYLSEIKQSPESCMKKETHHFS